MTRFDHFYLDIKIPKPNEIGQKMSLEYLFGLFSIILRLNIYLFKSLYFIDDLGRLGLVPNYKSFCRKNY
jgi:hypothetical protein